MKIQNKFTEKTISKQADISTSLGSIFALLWPQIFIMYLLCVMNIVPIWAAGKMSASVQAAYGVSVQVLFFLNVVSVAISAGAVAVISHAIGARKMDRAHAYTLLTIALNIFCGVLLALFGWIFTEQIFSLLALKGQALQIAYEFWDILLLALPFSYILGSCATLFRSFREVKIPLFITAFVCALHFFFTLGLSFGDFGIEKIGFMGIAWAYFIAQAFGSILSLFMLYRCGFLRFITPKLKWLIAAVPRLFKTAFASGATSLLWQGGNLTLYYITASLPFFATDALAGLSAGNRIESMIFMIGMAFNMSASVLVGNCLGARKLAEARRVASMLIFGSSLLMSVIALLLVPFIYELSAFVSAESLAQHYTAQYLIFNLASTPFATASMVFGGVMIGARAAHFNLLIFGLCFWVVRIPLAFYLGHFVMMDASGIFLAMLLSQAVQAAAILWVFFHIDWTKYANKKA